MGQYNEQCRQVGLDSDQVGRIKTTIQFVARTLLTIPVIDGSERLPASAVSSAVNVFISHPDVPNPIAWSISLPWFARPFLGDSNASTAGHFYQSPSF